MNKETKIDVKKALEDIQNIRFALQLLVEQRGRLIDLLCRADGTEKWELEVAQALDEIEGR